MFKGQSQHNIDAKGRMIVPAKFRDGLGEKFVLTVGVDKCLSAFPRDEWRKLEDKVSALPATDASVRLFVRVFFGNAYDAEADSQWRALIPSNLLEYAGITKEVVSVGVASKVEIWSKEAWNGYGGGQGDIPPEVLEKMAEFGI